MSQYRDYTHITEVDPINKTILDANILQLATWISNKAYGVDVREALVRAVETIGELEHDYDSAVLYLRQLNADATIEDIKAMLEAIKDTPVASLQAELNNYLTIANQLAVTVNLTSTDGEQPYFTGTMYTYGFGVPQDTTKPAGGQETFQINVKTNAIGSHNYNLLVNSSEILLQDSDFKFTSTTTATLASNSKH
ncbi:hypothetical protein, partial [Paucilactobacillus suebicus]